MRALPSRPIVPAMLVFVRHLWLCIQYAWRGSLSGAKSWAILGLGGMSAVAGVTGYSVEFIPGVSGAFLQGLAAISATWLLIFLWRLLLAPSRIHAEAEAKVRTLEAELAKPPLEIVFDPANPGRRFWSLERREHPSRPDGIEHYHECRIEVRNASPKTIRNVRVVKEHTGMMPLRPVTMPFDLTRRNSTT